MPKRSITDQFTFGNFETDPFSSEIAAADWNLIEAASNVADIHSSARSTIGSSYEDTSAGPDATAIGGKKSGGATVSGGGNTSGGGTTTGTGTTGSGTTTGQGTTTTVMHDIPVHWQTLNPP